MPTRGNKGFNTPRQLTFYETVTAAVADMTRFGYDKETRLEEWIEKIKEAAKRELTPVAVMQQELTKFLRGTYARLIEKADILNAHENVSKFTLDRVAPRLRAELDRAILASASLIKLNREQSITQTLRRFAGWATSIPAGGSKVVDKNDEKKNISKSLKSLPFEERRVIIDQGHKFVSSLNSILAHDAGALAFIWHSNWRQQNYNYRKDHKERDLKCYAIRGNWALAKGLMQKGLAGYSDEITACGEEVFCRCHAEYIYNLDDLPADMLTKKGAAALQELDAMGV